MLVLGLVDVPMWLILLLTVLVMLYWYGTRNHNHFKRLGIPGPRPLPFVGNILTLLSGDFRTVDRDLLKEYGPVVGMFTANVPFMLISDQEMISQVTVKQFPYFQNRTVFRSGDPILEAGLTSIEDDQWKRVRSIMSPTFTTGKLRQMAPEINRSAKELAKKMTNGEAFETRGCVGAYTMDVIASTAFGLRVDSQNSEDNPFVVNGKKVLDISFTSPLFVLFLLFPKLLSKLGYSILGRKAVSFFTEITKQTLEARTGGDKSRSDFIQLMSNARHGDAILNKEDEDEVENHQTNAGKSGGLTENEILGNALLFFLAGFDTTSVGLTQLFYCLACNPEAQAKVHEEIDTVIGDEEDVSLDDLMKLQYLDQCMHESLRLYPPAPRIDRMTKEDIVIDGLQFKKGTTVGIPVYALHHDANIWPDPEKFDPERFSPEEKGKRNPIMWLPFGFGPRNCIGMRLAIFELKIAVVHVLLKHKIVTCEKTENPPQWEKGKWLKAKNGIWLKTETRK